MKKEPKRIVSVQIPETLHEKIQKLADEEYTTNSTIIRKILENYFKKN